MCVELVWVRYIIMMGCLQILGLWMAMVVHLLASVATWITDLLLDQNDFVLFIWKGVGLWWD